MNAKEALSLCLEHGFLLAGCNWVAYDKGVGDGLQGKGIERRRVRGMQS